MQKKGYDVLGLYNKHVKIKSQKIIRILKINFNCIIDDFSSFFSNCKFTDNAINGIKIHRFLVEWRIQRSIAVIKKILKEFEKPDIYKFLVWIYSGKLPKKFSPYRENHKNLIDIFNKFEISLDDKKNNFQESIKKLFLDEKSKDFSIIVNQTNEKIQVHKLVLQCRSKLFQNMFESIEEPNIDHVQDYSKRSKESLQLLIEYLYTGKIESNKLNRKIKSQLEDAADYYQLNENCSFDYYIGIY
ncbi:pep-cterm sorting domain-containing protein [Anaeramoeba flamelloides]|uniref:Pep-cterm sorting domain-containing protein n=1 Tax=Anaeramoeba flamelloides TaxID=1746091 RepID=A0ABQ8XF56_9EUKA|nr:pep-cterm sorting domain-containing protein [Anaeramoeba flamelloides]